MKLPSDKQVLQLIVTRLMELLKVDADGAVIESEQRPEKKRFKFDMLVNTRDFRFAVEYKSSSLLGSVAKGIEQLLHNQAEVKSTIPLLVVPYMGESGMRKCAEAGVCWLDLSGNVHIYGPGLMFLVRGEENKFKQPGRRENPFSPKSSRIARHLLYHPHHPFSQRELSADTGLGEGYVSRIVKTFEAQNLIERAPDKRLSVKEPKLMLEAWMQGYDFSKHDIIRGHVAGRSGSEVQTKLSEAFKANNLKFAATGLGAAWLYSEFAAFRTVSFYINELPSPEVLEQIGFRESSSGANVWLIVPKDEDVFHGVKTVKDVPVVHPIQVYLDLKSHPERAEEAAEELRRQLELT